LAALQSAANLPRFHPLTGEAAILAALQSAAISSAPCPIRQFQNPALAECKGFVL
jgi:hypothetical protein